MLITRRRSTLAAFAAGLIIALLPTAADACDDTELTLVYVYKKIDVTAPASWQNSGEQRLIQVRNGLSWTGSIDVSVLPEDVCGEGWAIQEDQTRGLERDAVPTVVDRRSGTGVLGWPPIVDARHGELSAYVADVPECAPVVPVEPVEPVEPVVTPSPTPSPTSPPVVAPVAPPTTAPVVVEAARAAAPVVAAPSFAG